MSGLRLGQKLFDAWSEAAIPAFDHEAGRAGFLESLATHKPRARRASFLAVAVAAAVACACVGGVQWWRTMAPVSFTTASGEGRPDAWLSTASSAELPLTFSEGTRLVMAPGSRGRVEELGHAGASFLLERGEVRARVKHRPDTSWRFLAGPFEVQVTGTALGVEWDPSRERFAVRVDEGSVAVEGPSVVGAQVVRAGEQCVIDLPSRTLSISPSDAPPRAAQVQAVDGGNDGWASTSGSSSPPPAAHPSSAGGSSAGAPVSWMKLEEKGDYDAAYAAALGAGLASVLHASSSDELLRLAQMARLSGHRDTEREALVTCRRRFPGSERAAVAAYELGRSSSPSEASSWFDTYLGEQPNGPLAREASGRLIEARASAGDDRGARDAAARYLSRYPEGPHAVLARRVLAGAHE